MTGTLVNVGAIVLGALAGAALGERLPERVRTTVTDVLGLFVLVLGIADALDTFGPELAQSLGRAAVLVVLGSLLLGGLIGEAFDLEGRLTRLGGRLRSAVLGRAGQDPADDAEQVRRHRFVEGFVATTLLVCVGPLAVLGALENGLTGAFPLLSVKSALDGFAALAFASALGIGVAFAALPLLVYQGGLTLAAATIAPWLTDAMVAAIGAVGGFLVVGIGLRLLRMREIRVANLLPALLVAPVVIAVWP